MLLLLWNHNRSRSRGLTLSAGGGGVAPLALPHFFSQPHTFLSLFRLYNLTLKVIILKKETFCNGSKSKFLYEDCKRPLRALSFSFWKLKVGFFIFILITNAFILITYIDQIHSLNLSTAEYRTQTLPNYVFQQCGWLNSYVAIYYNISQIKLNTGTVTKPMKKFNFTMPICSMCAQIK